MFNGNLDPKSRKLKTHFRLGAVEMQHKDDEGDELPQYVSSVYWKMAVDGPFKSTNLDSSDDSDDDDDAAYNRMGKMPMA